MGTGDLRMLIHLALCMTTVESMGFLLQSHHPLREPGLETTVLAVCFHGRCRILRQEALSPGSGFQTGTSLLQALSRVWGTSCLLIQEVSGWGGLGPERQVQEHGLGSPNLPGPQPPPLQGERHHSAYLGVRNGVSGDDVSLGLQSWGQGL